MTSSIYPPSYGCNSAVPNSRERLFTCWLVLINGGLILCFLLVHLLLDFWHYLSGDSSVDFIDFILLVKQLMMGDHDYSMMSLDDSNVSNVDEDLSAPVEPKKKKRTPSRGRLCVSFGCNNYQYDIINGQRINNHRKYFEIPTETNLKNLWCKLMRREDGRDGFVVSKETRVCDAHFLPSAIVYGKLDRKADPKPILHSWNNFTVKEPRRRLVRQVDVEDVADVPSTSEEMDVEMVNVVDEVIDVDDAVDFDACRYKVSSSTQTERDVIEQLRAENYKLNAKVEELETTIEKLNLEKAALSKTIKEKFKEHILSNDEECSNNTGFHSVERMNDFFDFLDPGEKGENVLMSRSQNKLAAGRPRILTPYEGFLLMLCRLRSGFTIKHLSFLFCASVGAVESHFFMWLSFTYLTVARLNWWPSKDTVVTEMPKSMKEKYPSTRVIIDCTEFYAENPGKLSLQKLFYSSYKSRVTVKSLVGIMPGGGFSFVSSAFPGSISDRDIVQKSGLLNLPYEVGDAIMADRGFTIKDLL